jgi:hypothetical protein
LFGVQNEQQTLFVPKMNKHHSLGTKRTKIFFEYKTSNNIPCTRNKREIIDWMRNGQTLFYGGCEMNKNVIWEIK